MNKVKSIASLLAMSLVASFVFLVAISGQAQVNQPPTWSNLTGPLNLTCNQTGTWTASAYETDSARIDFTVNWGDSSANSTAVSYITGFGDVMTQTFNHSFNTNGVKTITFTISDPPGAVSTQTFTTTVSGCAIPNQPPVFSNLTGPLTLTCNQTGTYNVAASDPDGTSLTFGVNWGDGSVNSTTTETGALGATLSHSFTHSYSGNGAKTLTFTITDAASATTTQTFTTTVSGCGGGGGGGGGGGNMTPSIDHLTGPVTLTCNQTGSWNFAAYDPDGNTLTFTINWGDGSADTSARLSGNIGQVLFKDFGHAYTNAGGDKTITFTATDSYNSSVSKTLVVTVNGCGGGGTTCTAANTPDSSVINLSTIPYGTTNTPNINLGLSYGADVKSISLSNYDDFRDQITIDPVSNTSWQILDSPGLKTVYGRFYGKDKQCYVTYGASVVLQSTPPRVLGEECINITNEIKSTKYVDQGIVNKYRGRILRQTELADVLWYVDVSTGQRFFLPPAASSLKTVRLLAKGATNNDLNKIPVGLISFGAVDTDKDGLPDVLEEALGLDKTRLDSDADGFNDKVEVERGYNPLGTGLMPLDSKYAARQAGQFLLQTESAGELWYVNPKDNKRYYIPNTDEASVVLTQLAVAIANKDIHKIKVGDSIRGNELYKISSCYPKVLGATTLPRTGMPAVSGLLALPAILGYPWLKRRYGKALKRYYYKLSD